MQPQKNVTGTSAATLIDVENTHFSWTLVTQAGLLVAVIGAAVTGAVAWSRSEAKAQENSASIVQQGVAITNLSTQQTAIRDDMAKINAKTDVLTERSTQTAKQLDRIEQSLRDLAQEKRRK